MPTVQAPGEFTDEELLALLRDESVSIDAIVDEMDGAGSPPIPEEELRITRALLREFPIEEAETFSTLGTKLRELLLTEAVNARACDFVAALAACSDKSVAKIGKRGIHALRTRGVAVETRKVESTSPSAPAPGAEALPTFMSMPSALGTRNLYFAFSSRSLVDVAHVKLSDTEGVLEASTHLLSRKDFRRIQDKILSSSYPTAEIPHAYARSLVSAALDRNARARRAVPQGFNDVAFLIGGDATMVPSPGRAIELRADETTLVARGAELFRHPDFETWGLLHRELEEVEQRRVTILESQLYLDEVQRENALREAMEEQVRGWFTPEHRTLVAERLFDAAAILWSSNDQERDKELSQLAVASARALESGRDIMTIPFAVGFIDLEQRDSSATAPALQQAAVDLKGESEQGPELILPR